MTSTGYEIVNGAPEQYNVNCPFCGIRFDASLAEWCRCASKIRSVACPGCSTCCCRATAHCKESFWAGAPREMRENTNRFRLGDGTKTTELDARTTAPSVLVVDDEEDMRSLVACYVEQMGYRVTTLSSPLEALLLLAATRFDVVITDALMPAMDGRILCQKVKERVGDAIKVIVMTSLYTASRYRTEARYRFQADDYLAKPLRFGALKSALDRLAPIAA